MARSSVRHAPSSPPSRQGKGMDVSDRGRIREAVAPFIDHARAAGAPPRRASRSCFSRFADRSISTPDKERSKAVRQWAQTPRPPS